MFAEMGMEELRTAIGNAAYFMYLKLPYPKPDYINWYYGIRNQSFADLESAPLRCMENADVQAQD